MLCLNKDGEKSMENLVNHENVLHLELVNSNKDESLINANKHVYEFDEKRLHDAAAIEVMQTVDSEKMNDAGDRVQTKKKRKEMTSEEKSKQSRDRNREHARNTRLRKKVYVTKLKEFVENLSEQKRSEVKQCAEMGARIHEMHSIRKERVRLFLSYRANNIQERSVWASILDDEHTFCFTQPYIMYRHFQNNPACTMKSDAATGSRSSGSVSNSVAGSSVSAGSLSRSTPGKPSDATSGLHIKGTITPFRKNSGQVVIQGIDGMMVDCDSLKLMIEGIGEGTQHWTNNLFYGRTCSMRYEVSQHGGMLASGDTVFCSFTMFSDGITIPPTDTSDGVSCDGFVIPGTLDCKFSTENKIVSVEMTLDVAAIIKQYEFMTALCPYMTKIIQTSLDRIQANTETPHVVVCKVPLGAALVVYVNEAYWLSIGVDPSSPIAQMECWRGVSVMDFLTILQHPYNLYKDPANGKGVEAARHSIADNFLDSFDDQSLMYKPHILLPQLLHNQVVGNVESAFVQGRASLCSYCSLSPKSEEMFLNYVKFFPIMHNTESLRQQSGNTTTHSGQAVSHVLLVLKRSELYGQEAREAKAAVFAQYQQFQQQQQQQFHRPPGGMSLGQSHMDQRIVNPGGGFGGGQNMQDYPIPSPYHTAAASQQHSSHYGDQGRKQDKHHHKKKHQHSHGNPFSHRGFHLKSSHSKHTEEDVTDAGPVTNPLHGMTGGKSSGHASNTASTLSRKMNIPIPQNLLFPPNSSKQEKKVDSHPKTQSDVSPQISSQFTFPQDTFSSKQSEMAPYQEVKPYNWDLFDQNKLKPNNYPSQHHNPFADQQQYPPGGGVD